MGNCGPNTLAYMLGLVKLTEVDGVQLRRIVSDHSKAEGVLQQTTSILLEDVGARLRERLLVGLIPAGAATLVWLSPLSREGVHRILYLCAVAIGLLLIGLSAALYLDIFG